MQLQHSPIVRSLVAAAVAFTFYAAWAWWANRMHSPSAQLMAALTQGAYSASVTLALTSVVELLYRGRQPRRVRFARCVIGSVVLLVVSSVGIHLLAGTAELWLTVLPSWIFGSAYAVAYAMALSRGDRECEETAAAGEMS
ncbi:MAG: hypothetical protein AAF184_05580 [Pseudomonadota bacterium]